MNRSELAKTSVLLLCEEEFERKYGPLRSVVKRAVSWFLECGILKACGRFSSGTENSTVRFGEF
jgi:hypothetical protein